MPTLRPSASGPGHSPFPYRELYRLHPPQRAPLFRRVARPSWVVFPRTGEGRGEPGWPPAALPLKPGKNKRGGSGVSWSAWFRPIFSRFGGFYVLSAIFGHRFYLCPPPSLGIGRFNAGGCKPLSLSSPLPCIRPALSASVARIKQNALCAYSVNRSANKTNHPCWLCNTFDPRSIRGV